nr:DNA helicase [Tanacetum cinerariifolium]
MKTKRKLVPKYVVMGNVGEPKIMGVMGSCVSHVGEGSRPSVPSGSQLECLVGRVVDGRHMGNINDAGLYSAGNVIDDVGCSFHVDELIRTHGLQTLGTSLNDTRKQSRHTTTVLANTDGNVASSSANRKRTRGVMSRTATSNVVSSSSSTRRRLHSGRHSANTSMLNDDSVFLADTSNVHTNDFSLRGNRTCPPLEYKDVGKCDHSCEHCDARFSYVERIKDNQWKTHPTYHRCCQLYHWLGSLCPAEGDPPRFLQLYVYDTKNKVDNRMAHFGGNNSGLRKDIVKGLIELLDNHNALVKLFRIVREKLLQSEVPPFKVRLFNVVEMDFDIVIEQRICQPQHVNKLHPSYMALQFSLLFVYGKDGYSKDMKMARLPRSFTGGPHYMYAHYLDALAICRVHKNPTYFITFTCNVKWPEISDYIVDFLGVTTANRADIVDRVFEMKIHQFVKYLRDSKPFSKIIAIVYTVEFQKSGIPHCHTLVWIDKVSRTQNQEEIDNYISDELPSEKIDPEGKIVLVVASSGIALLLLPSGRTAHSRFKLPLDLNDSSVCSITKNTQLAKLLKETDLIIWDESPMNDRRCFETLDRILRDILDTPTKLFSGKPIMLGGDFRQTLPIKKKASRTEIISDGTLGVPDDTDPANTSWIKIPAQFQIPDDQNGVTKLINFIYDEHTLLHPTAKDFQDKAILCPKNDTADVINAKIMNMLPGHNTTYIRNDEAMPY